MSTALQEVPELDREQSSSAAAAVTADGKFLRAGTDRFLIKGVTYGTFAPDADGYQFPPPARIAEDFGLMRELGVNTVRVYTPPRRELLDQAARNGLRVMVGLPWSQHIAFLDDRALTRAIRRETIDKVRELGDHPALLMFALGNEIPPGVVRWHGRLRVERFLRRLYSEAKEVAPDRLFTYVNFPPTEFLDLSFLDVCAFNVYLHREHDLRAYLARLQHIAGQKPLLLAEAGVDSIREGGEGQAALTAMHLRAAFEEGACGAIAFAWTDEWWRGGHEVDDWAFGLVDRARNPKPAAAAVASVFANAPFDAESKRTWPRVSVVVCAYNAADTLEDCLSALERLTYPDFEIVVVNDGSRDRTGDIARAHPGVTLIEVPNGGLSAARNIGLSHATGEIIAYTDADTRVDPDWLTFLVQPFLTSEVVGSGGPNVVPADDPPMAQCIARAPGGPTHVLLDDRIAEHVPGCNMAFRRDALLAIRGFNPIYLRAGDDVDVCWRLQARGWKIGFAASALVWHHHRASIKAYWRQQVGYGEGEKWLMAHHPEKFLDGRMLWHGRIYSPLPFVRSLWGARINAGVWGTAAFPSVYRTDIHPFAFLPHSVDWQIISILLTIAGAVIAPMADREWAAALLLGAGLIGIAATLQKNVAYSLRSELSTLRGSHFRYRATVAYLHFLQPFARAWGLIRGVLAPPEVTLPIAEPQTSRGPRPSLREAWRALLLGAGSVVEDRFWSETWTSADRVLRELTDWLRGSRALRRIVIDEGWSLDRDISILIGRWAWLDVRALVEEHGGGKSLRADQHASAADEFRRRELHPARGGAAREHRGWRGAALSAGGRGGGPDRRDARRLLRVQNRAGHRHPAPGRQGHHRRPRHDGHEVGAGAAAAPVAVAAAHLRAADRDRLPDCPARDRGGHVHAARSGHRPDHRRAEGLCGRQRARHRSVARYPGRRHRLAVRRALHCGLEQPRHPPGGRGEPHDYHRRGQQLAGRGILGRLRTGHRRPAEHARWRRDRGRRRPHRRRLAQSPGPARRPRHRRDHDDCRVG